MKSIITSLFVILIFLSGCEKESGLNPNRLPDRTYHPIVNTEFFIDSFDLDHPYVPFKEGYNYIFEGTSEGEKIRKEQSRSLVTKRILGVLCLGIVEQAWEDDELEQETIRWMSQDLKGNVWLLGVEVNNYDDDGDWEDDKGSWMSGVEGALPGLWMPVNVSIGYAFRNGYHFNHMEDKVKILHDNLRVETAYGVFENCIQAEVSSELTPDEVQLMYYAPQIGLIKSITVNTKESFELINIE